MLGWPIQNHMEAMRRAFLQRVFIPSLPHSAMFEFGGLFLSARMTQAKQDKSIKKV